MNIPFLLYLILMPIVYSLIGMSFHKDISDDKYSRDFYYKYRDKHNTEISSYDYEEKWKTKNRVLIFTIKCLFYYLIEIIYCILMNNMFGTLPIFKAEIDTIDGCNIMFVFCSIVFILAHSFFAPMWMCIGEGTSYPIAHIIVLFIFFGIYMLFCNSNANSYYLSVQEWCQETYTINLHSLGDTIGTDGSVNGTRYYIRGSITDNYKIFYSFIDENGDTIIRDILYNEETVKIREDNNEIPRLETTKHYRSYKEEYEEYYTYRIYIPEGSNGFNINFQ